MRTRVIPFFMMLAPLIAGVGWAQPTGRITGTVSSTTGEKLIGANVVLEGTGLGTAADQEGRFEFRHLRYGTYTIRISYIGYYEATQTVILDGPAARTDIVLRRHILPTQEVVVTAERARERETPVAFSNLSRTDIEERYWAQDVPMLLSDLPNVYSYSDAGNGIGYSYLKIRGFDQKRVGVMVNGIPLNDPEDHQVYWVDLPDLAESVEDIQVQRGSSNSLYGTSAFGGSVNLVTSSFVNRSGIWATLGSGSYNTRKFNLSLNSGLVNGRYAFHGRFSRIVTDGYRERAGVDLWAYFLSATRITQTSTTRINLYGGPELTHAAWDAIPEALLRANRRANPANPEEYPNTIDNFNQPHYELLHEWRPSEKVTLANTFFYVKGKGYYEGLKKRRDLVDFGYRYFYAADSVLVRRTDLVRQKWVEKDQVGWIPRLEWRHRGGTLTLGGELNSYRGEHWGKVLWARTLPPGAGPDHTYYTYVGKKVTAAVFAHELYRITPRLNLMADLQLQFKKYRFEQQPRANFVGPERNAYAVDYVFANPKLGLNYNLNQALNLFASAALSQREPADADYYDTWDGPDDLGVDPLFARSDTVRSAGQVDKIVWSDPLIRPEKLIDYEIGFGYQRNGLRFNAGGYWMDFRNEIIPYGQVDDDGQPIKGNAERTVHRGIELSLRADLTPAWRFSGNLALSQNFYRRFLYRTWDENWNVVSLDYSGNSIPLFPGRIANARLSYSKSGVRATAHVQHIGSQQLDSSDESARRINAYTVLNLALSVDLGRLFGNPGWLATLRINNALDRKYETSGYYDPWSGSNYYYPAAERNFFVSLAMRI